MRRAARPGFLPLTALLGTAVLLAACTANEKNEAGYTLTGRGPSSVQSDTLIATGIDTSWSVALPLIGSSRLFAGEFSGYEAVTLLSFADLPAGATVTGATFILDGRSATVDDSLAPITLQLAPVTASWDSTWTGADLGLLTLGSPAAERSVLLEAALDTVRFSLPPSLVQSWVDDPVAAERGLALSALTPAPFMISSYSGNAAGTAATTSPRILLTYIPDGEAGTASQTIYPVTDLALIRYTPGGPDPGTLLIGRGAPFRTMLSFDLSEVPATATVNRAELHLRLEPDPVLSGSLTLAAALPLDLDPWTIQSGAVLQEGSISYALSVSEDDTTATLNVTPTLEAAVLAGETVLRILLLSSEEPTGVGFIGLREGLSRAERARLEIVWSGPPGGGS
jgi:hypothetical protein